MKHQPIWKATFVNLRIFHSSNVLSTTNKILMQQKSQRLIWNPLHIKSKLFSLQVITMAPFFVFKLDFRQSSLDQLQCSSADYKVPGPLNLLGCRCSSNYSVSTHALQIGVLWQLHLVLYLATCFLSFKKSSGPKPCEEKAPCSNFLLVENRVKDDHRRFYSMRKRPQSALLDHFTCKRTVKFINGNCRFLDCMFFLCIWSSLFSVQK